MADNKQTRPALVPVAAAVIGAIVGAALTLGVGSYHRQYDLAHSQRERTFHMIAEWASVKERVHMNIVHAQPGILKAGGFINLGVPVVSHGQNSCPDISKYPEMAKRIVYAAPVLDYMDRLALAIEEESVDPVTVNRYLGQTLDKWYRRVLPVNRMVDCIQRDNNWEGADRLLCHLHCADQNPPRPCDTGGFRRDRRVRCLP